MVSQAISEDLVICAVSLGEDLDSSEEFFGIENIVVQVTALWESIGCYVSEHSGELLSIPLMDLRAAWSPSQCLEACQCALDLVSGRWHPSGHGGFFGRAGIAIGRCTVEVNGLRRESVSGEVVNEARRLSLEKTFPSNRVYTTDGIIAANRRITAKLASKGGAAGHQHKDVYEIQELK